MPKNNKKPYADSTTKTETTIAALTALLEATPAAEELSSTWTRSGSQTRKNDGPRLKDLKEFLDSGKATGSEDQRGIPMWIVVRMCKATWHQDGTWPLLGIDEHTPPHLTAVAALHSVHPSALLLRPKGADHFQIPTDDVETFPVRRPEPSADDIAEAYRRRGMQVAEAVSCIDDW